MVLDLLFPKTCLSCGHLGSYICLTCERRFIWLSEKTVENKGVNINKTLSILKYESVTKKIIKKLKYKFLFDAFHEFFQVITPQVIESFSWFKRVYPNAYLQPIPLHPQREKWRGFNQSMIIAQYFHKMYDYPVLSVLQRTKNTVPQAAERSREARKTNMNGAFSIVDPTLVEGKHIILVDDVITTGYTIDEAAHVLKKSGTSMVSAFSLARGL